MAVKVGAAAALNAILFVTEIGLTNADDAAVKAALSQQAAPGVSVTMKSVWLGVLFVGFMMAFSGKAWTMNVGFNTIPSVFAAMTAMSSQQKNPSLPQSDYFPIAVGAGVFIVCYFLCWMLHEIFMSTVSGFMVSLIFVIGVASIGTPSFPMMSVGGAFIGFCMGAFAGYYYSETEEFNKWIIRLTAGLLMGVSVNAISTGGDIMVTFMNSVAKARENPAYINDARKAAIILATEWATFAVFTVLGGPIVDCIWDAIADACGCGHRGDGEAGKALEEGTELTDDAREAANILATEWASFAVFTVLGGIIVDGMWGAIADACGCGYRRDNVADGEAGKALDGSDLTGETPLSA